MATVLPAAGDTLVSDNHARLHRCIASDSSAADSSVVVNAAGFPVVASLTASEILATNASKALTSLAVATYPSLTELSYVKGVTSAVQSQINAKGVGTVTSVATTGLISGGTITNTGTITTSMATGKLVGRGTAGAGIMEEITLGTNLSLSGTTLNATGGTGATATRGVFSKTDMTYTFTTATPSVNPTAGATYTNNGFTFTVVSYNTNVLICTGTGYPTASGTLTKASGTGDSTLAYTAFTATYVVTHNLALSTSPYTVIVNFANGATNKAIGNIDDITYAANSMKFETTSLGSIHTGTIGYAYIAG